MNLLESLLDAIVRLEGDALVMHVGEKPYVVTTSASMNAYRGPLAWGQVELSSRVLTSDAVLQMLTQILPAEQRQALDELGAIEHEIQRSNGATDRFTIVAARGGDDVWLEVRRRQPDAAVEEPAPVAGAPANAAHEPASAEPAPAVQPAAAAAIQPPAVVLPHSDALYQPVDWVSETAADAVAPASPEASETELHDVAHAGDVEAIAEPAAAAPGEIEIVHEELQAVPTDAEVDAMLAATAAQLLQGELPGTAIIEIDEHDHFPVETTGSAAEGELEAAEEEELILDSLIAPSPVFSQQTAEEALQEPEVVLSDAASTVAAAEPHVEARPEPVGYAAPQPVSVERVEAQPEPEHVPQHAEAAGERVEAPPASPLAAIVAGAFAAEAALAIERAVVMTEPDSGFVLTPPTEAAADATGLEAIPDAVAHAVAAADATEPLPFDVQPAPGVAEHPEPVAASAGEPFEPVPAATPAPRMDQHEALPPSPYTVPVEASEGVRAGVPAIVEPGTAAAAVSQDDVRGEVRSDASKVDMTETPRPTLVPPPVRPAAQARVRAEGDAGVARILQAAATLGASIVYVVAQSRPMVRVDGEIGTLDSESVLSAEDVDAIVAHLDDVREAGNEPATDAAEWLCDVREVGRVRYLTFHDHRGPGVIFRMTPPRAISAEHLGLPAEVLALCGQPDGLVLVTGAHGSGKSTMLTAFLDLINRSRSDHVISIESQIAFVHESRKSFISQRELRGDSAALAAAVRRALLEDPDVLFVEDLGSADLVAGVLEAAESGRLVFASVQAPSATAALEQIVELFPAERRAQARTALAGSLRGVVAQVLLRKVTGGRIAAREVLLNSPAVASLILEGKMVQLPAALESGRRHGMVPLTDSLAGLVREGIVHVGEAYRKAVDRDALLAVLKREGVDTSFAERLA